MRTKKSKYLGRQVTLCRLNRQTGHTEKISGIFKGYLGKKNVVIDTGKGLYEQFVIGSAPGRWIIFPASVQLVFESPPSPKSSPEKKRQKRHIEDESLIFVGGSVDNDDLLPPDWSSELDSLAGNDPYRFSVDFEADF